MVLDSFEEEDFLLDLNAIRVAHGSSQGRSGSEYLRGRVDKGCFDVIGPSAVSPITANVSLRQQAKIGAVAKITEPYAVFLR
jgi:hypothetical protein